jgi:hypothetical protein
MNAQVFLIKRESMITYEKRTENKKKKKEVESCYYQL